MLASEPLVIHATTEGHVWGQGPAIVSICAGVHGASYHQGACRCLGSGLQSEDVLVSVGSATAGGSY